MKKILFIHHGGLEGGAPLSMLYTMIGVRKAGYEPIAGLVFPSKGLNDLYKENGFETVDLAGVPLFNYQAASEPPIWDRNSIRTFINIARKKKAMGDFVMQVVKKLSIDFIHLNSVILLPMAEYLQEKNFPFVWHVREHAPKARGYRYKRFHQAILKNKATIFLSKGEQTAWTGSDKHGTVVHNFVDLDKFNPSINGDDLLPELGMKKGQACLLFLGGPREHKGITTLLNALEIVSKKYPDLKCLMPGTTFPDQTGFINKTKATLRRVMGDINLEKIVKARMSQGVLKSICVPMGFNPNILKYYALSDILVFPATTPHFARPVVEANAMEKPAIASDLSPLNEQVIHGETGLLSEPKNAEDLAEKIIKLLDNPDLRKKMGEEGRKFVKANFEMDKQIQKIVKVYQLIEA